jgi:DNA-binding PadR family transcriptional regulator
MNFKNLAGASAKPIILSLLLTGESYGYQIIKRVRLVSGGTLEWTSAMLYPVLHRMEKDGLIRSEWKASDENRLRKYYSITEQGLTELTLEKEQWRGVQEALQKLLGPIEAVD